MNGITYTLRISSTERDAARVSVRRHQFTVGHPIDFDERAPAVTALEYALGAVGAEIVGGLRAFARRRRIELDEVEAVVNGEIENPLGYLEVVGETGRPRIAGVHVKVYVASSEDEDTVRRLLHEALERLPLVCTLREAMRLDIDLTMTA
jgi:uncharacterized OsmC-like protein